MPDTETTPQMLTEPSIHIRKRGKLPHWTMPGATYFVTFRLDHGILNETEVRLIREHIQHGDPGFYTLIAVSIMPDHIHILLTPQPQIELSRIIRGMKNSLAVQINRLRNTSGKLWQPDWYDRIIRDEAEMLEKVQYMLNNPVKAGLIEDGWSYPGWFSQYDENSK